MQSLDTQYTVGVATNVSTKFVSVGSQTQDGINGFLDIINTLLAQDTVPTVLTTSFGFDETEFLQAPEIAELVFAYKLIWRFLAHTTVARTLCHAYAQLGARGTSVLFSSGDGGVGGSQQGEVCDTFVPTFPSGCP